MSPLSALAGMLWLPLWLLLSLALVLVGVFAAQFRDLGPKPAPAARPGAWHGRTQPFDIPAARPPVLPATVEAELDALRAIIDSMEGPA
jgi:hypothetical protein